METIIIGLLITGAVILVLALLAGLYWCFWSLYSFAVVPLGAPELNYWQFSAIWILITSLLAAMRARTVVKAK